MRRFLLGDEAARERPGPWALPGRCCLISPLSPGQGSLFLFQGQENQRHLSEVRELLRGEDSGADVHAGPNPELQREGAPAVSPRPGPGGRGAAGGGTDAFGCSCGFVRPRGGRSTVGVASSRYQRLWKRNLVATDPHA